MTNPYYNGGSFPATGSPATSASMRAELSSISTGFDKLPTLSGNANKLVVVNGSASALEATATLPAVTVTDSNLVIQDNSDATKKFRFEASSVTSGATRVLTVPDANLTLVGEATTQTLTNKTINLANNTLAATSAQLAAAVTDETGSGALVFGTGPTIDGPTVSNNLTLSGGTANGVLYLNGSKVATSGSALTFDGTLLRSSTYLGLSTNTTPDTSTGDAIFYKATAGATLSGFNVVLETGSAGSRATRYTVDNIGQAIWAISGSEQMRLTSTGLGIGTSNTSNGRLNVQAGTSATGNSGFFTNLDGTYNTYLQIQHSSAGVKLLNGNSFSGTANNLIFGNTSTSETMRIDGNGNLGLGVTPSAWGSVWKAQQLQAGAFIASQTNANDIIHVGTNAFANASNVWTYINTAAATRYQQYLGAHSWYTAPSGTAGNAISFTQAMTLDASGNLSIGTTTADIFGANYQTVTLEGAGTNTGGVYVSRTSDSSINMYVGTGNSTSFVRTSTNHPLAFFTNDTERARITSGGYFKASNNGTYASSAGSLHELKGNPDDNVLRVENYQATLTGTIAGVRIIYSAATPNTTTRSFIYCDDSTTLRAEIRSNGGLANYSGNDVNLSDRREKTNFAPAKSYLDVICAIPVQTFNYIDQSEDDPGLTLGVVAQDVQAVAPELVMESNWGTEDNPKMRLSIYQTDLQYALMKCVQELKAQNDELRARVAALEAKP